MSRPQDSSALMSAVKPRAATTACVFRRVVSLVRFRVLVDGLDPSAAARRDEFGAGDHRHAQAGDLPDQGFVGAERLAPVHDGHRPRERGQGERPVEGAVAATDDHDVPVPVLLGPRHEVRKSLALERSERRKGPRRERADPAGHHDEPGADPQPGRRRDDEHAVVVGQRPGFLAEQVPRLVPARLLGQPRDQVAAPDGGESGDVVDQFLRVHGADLAPDLRERVHHRYVLATEARVVGGVQADGACPYDQRVNVSIVRHSTPSNGTQVIDIEPRGC